MPRRPRFSTGGYVFHVLNRSAGRRTLFQSDADCAAFQRVLEQARAQVPMRVLAFSIMPNHWHLVLWPAGDDDLAEYMRWLTVAHTQRWHAHHGTSGTGPLYQGRFKSFPVEEDEHFLAVCRYVERNPLRANLVSQAEKRRWCSLWQRTNDCYDVTLDPWPVPLASDWSDYVNRPQTEEELAAIRGCVTRGSPYGGPAWQLEAARRLGLEASLRPSGRPRKT